MKNVSPVAANKSRNFSEQKLTIAFDLKDRSSWYRVLDEAGRVLLEHGLSPLAESPSVLVISISHLHPVPRGLRGLCSHVAKQHHKTEIHMALLMTMKQRGPRICRDKVDLRITLRFHHHHVFSQRRERPVVKARHLERMAM